MWLPYPGVLAASAAGAALAVTLLAHDGSNTNSANRATSSITVSAGDRIAAIAFARETTGAGAAISLALNMANFGGTWTIDTNNVLGSVNPKHTLMISTATVPNDITSTTAIPILAATGGQGNRWGWAFLKLSGLTSSTQTKEGLAAGTGNITPVLASAAGSGIQIAACCSVGLSTGGTTEGGWTVISNSTAYATSVLSWLGVACRIGGGDDGCTFTGLGATQNLGHISELA